MKEVKLPRAAHEQHAATLQAVADAVGASKAHIWELETGKSTNPSIELLTELAKHFDVPVASLIGENPNAVGEDPKIVAMYRDLKGLTEHDRETIRDLMNALKRRKKEKK
ncbi:MAG TPA: helix-turn-helix domain-containing protein [Smithellaceae bacterium]|nr:helix-turn-helix domain-containing protein [Geobacteraceae bacterium]HOS41994.1 helix-turn-helix domain-containing protein [Spirochaetota bacterium]HPL68028.1 helix-turn-helix domain-containing protein [Smithellaceae bacterium]